LMFSTYGRLHLLYICSFIFWKHDVFYYYDDIVANLFASLTDAIGKEMVGFFIDRKMLICTATRMLHNAAIWHECSLSISDFSADGSTSETAVREMEDNAGDIMS
ncbi:hypothetical protein ACJX0J_007204, partial [Zea mays]